MSSPPAASNANILLAADEIEALTGYQKPALQLQELHKQGFTRARVNVRNCLVLERVHYEAVCRGAAANGASIERERPAVRPPLRRAA